MSDLPTRAIDAAARMVGNDLERTCGASPAAIAALRRALASRRAWVEAWPEGAEHVPGLVAQDVQELMHASIDDSWPLCPEHLDHALYVEPDLGPDPFWVCERTGLPVAPVGGL